MFQDKRFTLITFFLLILTGLDALMTRVGLRLGFEEGNPIIIFFFSKFGIDASLIGVFVVQVIFFFLLNFFMGKLIEKGDKEWVYRIYVVVIIAIMVKMYVIGQWHGVISTKI